MTLPQTAYPAPVNITRASHVALTVRDLDLSETFYTQVIGLAVSARENDTLYLRGIEEACHHSLVLRRADPAGHCDRIGMRIYTAEELRAAATWFAEAGCATDWAHVPHQGATLHVTDPQDVRLEFCAHMEVMPRLITRFSAHRGGAAQRLDHYQLHVPDVGAALSFYLAAGFRLSEYIAPEFGERVLGAFLQRKGNPHDIVFFQGRGPQLHHFAYTCPDSAAMLRACDVAGELGWGEQVERGPGRHGPGHAFYTYFRDPDGHRVELFNSHYQVLDEEIAPIRWTAGDPAISTPWGLPARASWFEEATSFLETRITSPAETNPPRSLERYLGVEHNEGRRRD